MKNSTMFTFKNSMDWRFWLLPPPDLCTVGRITCPSNSSQTEHEGRYIPWLECGTTKDFLYELHVHCKSMIDNITFSFIIINEIIFCFNYIQILKKSSFSGQNGVSGADTPVVLGVNMD